MKSWLFLAIAAALWAALSAAIPLGLSLGELSEGKSLLSSLGKDLTKGAKSAPKAAPAPKVPAKAAPAAPAKAPAAAPAKEPAKGPAAVPPKESAAPKVTDAPKATSKKVSATKTEATKTSATLAASSRSALDKAAWPVLNVAGAKPPPTLAQAKAPQVIQGSDTSTGADPSEASLNLPPEMERRDDEAEEDFDDELFLRGLGIDPDTIDFSAPSHENVHLAARLAADGCPTTSADFDATRTKPIKRNSAMFYSGVHFRDATNFARQKRLTPIFRFVNFDAFPKDATKICPGFWNFASEAFAQQCQGRATVVMPPLPAGFSDVQAAPFEGVNLKSVWVEFEWKALQANVGVNRVVRTDLAGNTFDLLNR